MSDEIVDPAEVTGRRERVRVKKLAKGAPGHIRMTDRKGASSVGTRAVFFGHSRVTGLEDEEALEFSEELIEAGLDNRASPVTKLNVYFENRANRTLAEVYPTTTGELLCFIDVFLYGEELDDFLEVNEELQTLMDKRKQERAEKKQKLEAEAQEKDRLADEDRKLGARVREHNVLDKNRKLEATIAAMRAAGNRLAKKAGVKQWFKEDDDAA